MQASEDQTVLDALSRHTASRPERIAYRAGERTMTFAGLDKATNQIANAMESAGIRQGDRVACLTKRHLDCLMLALAACKVGAVCMPVNWRLAASEVAYILENGEAKIVLADTQFLDLVPSGGPTLLCANGPEQTVEGFEQWFAQHSDQFESVVSQTDDAALQLYSSGTTGLPKGVVLSHRGLLSTSRHVAHDWGFDENSVFGNPLPTFHVAGMTMLLLTLYVGGQTSAYEDFDPGAFIGAIEKDGVTHTFLVSAMLLFLLNHEDSSRANYNSLRLIAYGGSPTTETVLRHSIEVFGCEFVQIYGLTEVSGPATALTQQDHRDFKATPGLIRSAGQGMGGARLRIVNPATGVDLPAGETGEVWIETERNLKEYWRDPEATGKAFPEGRNERGGWFRSGDGGYLKDGYLYINDRIKDMIISGGENIYPAEIENTLMKHSDVADGAIIGVPDPKWGEAVKACVVRKPGAECSEQEIIDWMRERIAHFKCPKSVDFMEALPRNPSGKVLKRVLREPYSS